MKLSLIIIPLFAFLAIIVMGAIGSGLRETNPSSSGLLMILTMSMVYIPIIICSIISAKYAKRLNRSPAAWVLANIFLPFISPIILAITKPLNPPTPYTAPMPIETDRQQKEEITEDSIGKIQGFCEKCTLETTDEIPGNINSVNGIGTMLMGTRWSQKGLNPCPQCQSVVQIKWFTFGFGIKPLGTYRIRYLKQGIMNSKFFGRRLKNDQYRLR